MALIDASEFVINARNGDKAKEIRLGVSGKLKSFMLNATYIESSEDYDDGVYLQGTIVFASNNKVVDKTHALLCATKDTFLRGECGSFRAVSSGVFSPRCYFEVRNGKYGYMYNGVFVEKKLFSMREIKEKQNPFSTEPEGFLGAHTDLPTSVEILFRGIGCTVDVPLGNTVDSLIRRYVNK